MASISSAGIGSGLDIQSLVSGLMSAERTPLDALASKKKSYDAKISALGQLQNLLSTLKSKAGALSFGKPPQAVSANPDRFEATSDLSAAKGEFDITVLKLASAQKVATAATGWVSDDPSKTRISAGQLVITMGTLDENNISDPALRDGSNWSFTSNTNSQGNPSSFTIDFSGGTLNDLRTAINSATDADGNKIGISAQIISGASGAQLVLTSANKGNESAFSIDGSLGVSLDNGVTYADFNFSYDIKKASQNSGMREIAIPWSTQVDIDGIRTESNTNQIKAIPGITLTVKQISAIDGAGLAIPERLSVTGSANALKDDLTALVDAYNGVKKNISSAISYDTSTQKSGVLNGEGTVRSIMADIRATFSSKPTGISGKYSELYSIGLSFDRFGTLTLNAETFSKAFADDPIAVEASVKAWGSAINSSLGKTLDAKSALQLRSDSLATLTQGIKNKQLALENRLSIIEQRYLRQFSALDGLVASMQSTGAFLTQQLANLT